MRPSVKRAVRRATRALGYEVVPARGGIGAIQARVLSESHLVIDVGANVGQFGERLRSLDFAGQIVSFEPQSDAYIHLAKAAHGDPLWEIRNLALGEVSSPQVELFKSANSVSSSLHRVLDAHVLAAPRARAVGSEVVALSTLDVEFPDLDVETRAWLKIDVQGHELQVLEGSDETLKACAAVQVELSFSALYKGQSSWLEVCALLIEKGFQLQYLEPGFEDPMSGVMQQADGLFIRSE